MDREHEGIALGGIEVGRLDDPALDIEVVDRLVPDLLDFAEPDVGQDVVVHARELPDVAGAVEREGDDVSRLVIARERSHRAAALVDRGDREHVVPGGHRARLAIHRSEPEFELPVMAAVKYTPLPSRAQVTPESRRPSSLAMSRELEPSAFIT